MRRYESAELMPPNANALPASRTCRAPASASEYTATVCMPMACAVRMMRRAISPRLATSRVLIFAMRSGGLLAGLGHAHDFGDDAHHHLVGPTAYRSQASI